MKNKTELQIAVENFKVSVYEFVRSFYEIVNYHPVILQNYLILFTQG